MATGGNADNRRRGDRDSYSTHTYTLQSEIPTREKRESPGYFDEIGFASERSTNNCFEELKAISPVGSATYARMLPMPGMTQVQFTDARQREAAELANKMRAAYFYSKESNKRSKAIAKAKGRRAQRIAERR